MTGLATAAGVLAQAPLPTDANVGVGETILFWVLAPVLVLASLGLLFVRKAVHAALLLALVMIGLAVMYAAQDAPFLFAAQIVVYTGAVMMLFLFVLMLVGVDASDSLTETIRGQRLAAVLAGLGLVALLVGLVRQLTDQGFPVAAGLDAANAEGNPVGVAKIIFGTYVFAFELTGALLITAALGAIMMTHRERLVPKTTQRSLAERRVREGTHVPPLPAPGVFARHNAVDTPALLPDGTASDLSVSRVLRARGQESSLGSVSGDVAVIEADLAGTTSRRVTGTQAPADRRVDATGDPVDPATGQTGTAGQGTAGAHGPSGREERTPGQQHPDRPGETTRGMDQ